MKATKHKLHEIETRIVAVGNEMIVPGIRLAWIGVEPDLDGCTRLKVPVPTESLIELRIGRQVRITVELI